jgi:hypothetical protein
LAHVNAELGVLQDEQLQAQLRAAASSQLQQQSHGELFQVLAPAGGDCFRWHLVLGAVPLPGSSSRAAQPRHCQLRLYDHTGSSMPPVKQAVPSQRVCPQRAPPGAPGSRWCKVRCVSVHWGVCMCVCVWGGPGVTVHARAAEYHAAGLCTHAGGTHVARLRVVTFSASPHCC